MRKDEGRHSSETDGECGVVEHAESKLGAPKKEFSFVAHKFKKFLSNKGSYCIKAGVSVQ